MPTEGYGLLRIDSLRFPQRLPGYDLCATRRYGMQRSYVHVVRGVRTWAEWLSMPAQGDSLLWINALLVSERLPRCHMRATGRYGV